MNGPDIEPVAEEPDEVFKNEFGTNRKARRTAQKREQMRLRRVARYLRMLQNVDVPTARILWHDHNHRVVSDHELLVAIHTTRLTYPGISDEQRSESGRWLAADHAKTLTQGP